MKKTVIKRLLAFGLGLTMAMSLLVGCGSKETPNTSGNEGEGGGSVEVATGGDEGALEHVDLKMYLLGERTPDFDEVYGEINKILEEKLNCSLSVDFLSWGEHDTKYSLLFSSQEDFDLIFTASSWGHYEQTAALGGFYPLSKEFIQTYAPDIWDVVPEMAWNQADIGGEVYMVPNFQNEFGQDVVAVRGDLMDKYGFSDISNWEELKSFYMTIAAEEDGMYASQGGPWYQYFQAQGLTTTGGVPKGGELILYNTQDPSDLDFTYVVEWDGFAEYCKEVKEMADAGCWSKDILNSTEERQNGFLNGNVATMIWNKGSCRLYAKQANEANPDWKCTIMDPVSSQPKQVNSYINNGVAINLNSKNKERAMMVLNEFYTNPAVYDLTMMGIEGKHWEAVGEDQFKVLDQSGFGVDVNCNWGWKNATINRKEFIEDRTELDDLYDAIDAKWDNNVKAEHVYDGFNFDNAAVSTQVAAVEAALSTYFEPLANGLVSDVDASIADLKAALESAGIQDIIAELESQAAAYVAAQ